VFVAGVGNDDSFFPVSTRDEYVSQKEAAANFAREHGSTGKPSYGYLLTVYKDEVLSKDASGWKGNLSKFYPEWQSSAKEVVVPALKKINMPPNKMFYASVKWKDDPYKVSLGEAGKTDIKDGERAYPTVMYFDTVFNSKDEALAACTSDEKPPTATNTPSLSKKATNNGWTPETLVATRKTIEGEVEKLVSDGKLLPVARAEVAKAYSLEPDDIVWLDSTPF